MAGLGQFIELPSCYLEVIASRPIGFRGELGTHRSLALRRGFINPPIHGRCEAVKHFRVSSAGHWYMSQCLVDHTPSTCTHDTCTHDRSKALIEGIVPNPDPLHGPQVYPHH